MENYLIKVEKNGKVYKDLYQVWHYNGKIWYERMRPEFFKSAKIVYAHAIKVDSVQEMLGHYKVRYNLLDSSPSPSSKG